MLGNYIKTLREKKELSQRQLAYLAGLSNTEISRIESGARENPSVDTLKRLAPHLGVSLEDLMDKAGYIDSNKDTDNNKIIDDEVNELLETLRRRPEMKMLFSIGKKATKEDIEKAVKILEALKDN